MDFLKSIAIAASGLRAQAGRMRVISENIANADSTAQTPRWRSVPAQDSDLPLASSTARSTRRVVALGKIKHRQLATSASSTSPAIPAPMPTAM